MSNDIGKISVRQALLLFIVIFCAPAIRYVPLFTATQAKQAAWLSPFIALFFELIYILIWCKLLKKYRNNSFVDILKDILGKITGNLIIIIYFLWITLLLSYNVRMYVERIVSTALPHANIFLIMGSMMLLVAYIVKNGIITIAKMNELIFLGLTFIFILFNILILPEVHVEHLYPITYKDALPAAAGSLGIIAIFAYNILIFMFNDKIDHKGEFKKLGIKTSILLTVISVLVIIIPVGVFGAELLIKMPIPYLNTMMQISLFDVIERIEAGIIMFWIMTDFVLIAVFVFTAMHMIRVSFKLTDIRPLTGIYVLGAFFLSLAIGKSTLELKILSENVLSQMNVAMGFIIPIIIFFIGKIRKKV